MAVEAPARTRRVVVTPGRDGRVLDLVLSRGDRGNAIDMALARDLLAAAREVRDAVDAGTVDVVVLRAEGRHFCVGGDLHDFPLDPDAAVPYMRSMADTVSDAVLLLVGLAVPLVARVHGAAAGAGIGLAVLADVVVASTAAKFVPAYTGVGLSPDCGVSWLLPQLVGARRASDMILTNRPVPAALAEDWGLVSRVVGPDDLDTEVGAVVDAILAADRTAGIASKKLLQDAPDTPLRAHLAAEAESVATLGGLPHSLAAREAFAASARPATTTNTETA